jgi:hypothetical protein
MSIHETRVCVSAGVLPPYRCGPCCDDIAARFAATGLVVQPPPVRRPVHAVLATLALILALVTIAVVAAML